MDNKKDRFHNSNFNFSYKFLVIILIQILSVALLRSSMLAVQIAGMVLLGLINAHSIQVIHQCSHFSAYKNKKLNDFVGTILGASVFIELKNYRSKHFYHHKKLGTVEDVEVFEFNKIAQASSLFHLIPHIFGYSKYKSFLNLFVEHLRKRNVQVLTRIAFPGVLFTMTLMTVGGLELVFFWMLSLIFITEPIHFLIEIPEHYGCLKVTGEKYENTRTIKSVSAFAQWFTNWNNFHVEHHLYQWVLPENLEMLHDSEKAQLYAPLFENYLEFYKYFIKDIIKREATL